MHGELHAQPVQEGREPPGRTLGIRAGELLGGHAGPDDFAEAVLPGQVEVLADPAHGRVAHRLAPAVDPQRPRRLTGLRHVEGEHGVELRDGRRRLLQLQLQAGDVLLGGVAKRFRQEQLLGVEVVVDESGRDAQPVGHVGHPCGGESTVDHHLAGRLQDLVPPLRDRRPLHRCTTLLTRRPRARLPRRGAWQTPIALLLEQGGAAGRRDLRRAGAERVRPVEVGIPGMHCPMPDAPAET